MTTPQSSRPAAPPRRFSPFLLLSMGLLVLVALATIALLFVGDFSGRYPRVVSTLVVFVLFTVLTGFDTRQSLSGKKYYTPIALVTNVYTLALSLVVIWVRAASVANRPYDAWIFFWTFVGATGLIFGVCRAALFGASLLLRAQQYRERLLSTASLTASCLVGLCAVLFTIPLGFWAFGRRTPDLYWRLAVAVLIITAVAVAISSLLHWTVRGQERAQHPPVPPMPAVAHGWGPPPGPGPYGPSDAFGPSGQAPRPRQEFAPPQANPPQRTVPPQQTFPPQQTLPPQQDFPPQHDFPPQQTTSPPPTMPQQQVRAAAAQQPPNQPAAHQQPSVTYEAP